VKVFKLSFILNNEMRRIKSEEEIAKGKRRNKFIVGFVMIFLMVFSTAGFALYGVDFGGNGSSSSDSDINQQGPYYNGQYWIYNLGGQQFFFINSQELTSEIPVDIDLTTNDYANVPLFIDADSDVVINEIANNLGQFTGRVQRACYGACEEDLPEKDCSENLIVWQSEAEKNRVYQEEKCIFIDGDLTSVDAFLYRVIGLI